MERLKFVVAAGMIDRKLFSKIQPLLLMEEIKEIHLVRRQPFLHNKIINHSPVGFLGKSKICAEFYRFFVIIKLIITIKPHLLIGIGTIPHGIYTSILGKLFCVRTIILLMGNNDLFLTYPNRKVRQRFLLWITSLADYVGTRGTNSKKWLIKRGIQEEKIFIPHNTFDFKDFYPESYPKIYDLVYVGLINYYKRIDLLVHVISILVNTYGHKTIKLAIVGNGKIENKIRTFVSRNKLENNIIFLPSGDQLYLNEVFNKSGVFVLTSQGEGLPMVIIEAMSCGLPVVSFDSADISNVAIHGYNSLLCESGDVEQFAGNVHSVLKSDTLYNQLSEGALKIRDEKKFEYSPENLIGIWKKVIQSLFGQLNNY